MGRDWPDGGPWVLVPTSAAVGWEGAATALAAAAGVRVAVVALGAGGTPREKLLEHLATWLELRDGGTDPVSLDEAVQLVGTLGRTHGLVLVGGGHGLLVPVGRAGWTVADLAVALGAPVAVISDEGPDAVNHTTMALAVLDARKLTGAIITVGDDAANPLPKPTAPVPPEPRSEPTPAEPTPAEPTPAEPTPAEPPPAEPTQGGPPVEPTAGESAAEPIADDSPTRPIAGELLAEPTAGESAAEPIADDPPTRPIAGEPPAEPTAGQFADEPLEGGPPAGPIPAESPVVPTAAESQAEPIAGEFPTAPIPGESPAAPTRAEALVERGEGEPAAAPTRAEASAERGEGEPAAAPTRAGALVEPGEADPATGPTRAEASAEPGKGEPAAAPTRAEASADPEKGEPATGPAFGEKPAEPPEAEPTTAPPQGEPPTSPIAADFPLQPAGHITPGGEASLHPMLHASAGRPKSASPPLISRTPGVPVVSGAASGGRRVVLLLGGVFVAMTLVVTGLAFCERSAPPERTARVVQVETRGETQAETRGETQAETRPVTPVPVRPPPAMVCPEYRTGVTAAKPDAALTARVDGAWRRIEKWLAAKAPADRQSLRPPATAAGVQAAQERMSVPFPPDLVASLLRHDGAEADGFDLPFMHQPMAVDQIPGAWWTMCEIVARSADPDDDWWDKSYVPFATAGDGGYLLADQRPGSHGRVGEFFNESGVDFTRWPASVADLLEQTAASLETGKPFAGRFRPMVTDGRLTWEVR